MQQTRSRLPKFLAVALAALCLAGCSHHDRMKPVMQRFALGDFQRAAEEMTPLLKDRRDSDKDRTIYELEAGAIYAAAGDLDRSLAALGSADERMWEYLDDAPDVRVTEQAAAILTNQTIVTYRGTTYDRIMCCAYQALNHLSRGDRGKAMVSLRRALEWQQDALAKNAKEVEALEREADRAGSSKGYDTDRAMRDARTKGEIESAYGPLRDLTGYGEFEVPYATYLRGLVLRASGGRSELEQATVAFRRVAGMLGEADRGYALEDAAMCEAAGTGAAPPATVHVFLETGTGPWLREFKISIPLFLRKVPYVGAAFPVLERGVAGPAGFALRAAGEARPSAVLTDMDRVVGDDFNRRLPGIIAVTLVSSATKAIATYAIQESLNGRSNDSAVLAAVIGGIYQFATNSADLRIWTTLPKEVHYARCAAPADGSVEIVLGDGQRVGPIAVESNGVTIVHVRAPRAGATPAVRTMRLPVG